MKLVILDRDGVINKDSDSFIKSPDEWFALPGSLEAISSLNHAGYRTVIASNQSGLARGLFDMDTLNAIHRKMHDELEYVGGHIDGIFFCPHGPSDGCNCRKPRPGLLKQIGERFFTDLKEVSIIGDSLRDIEAAEAVGAHPMLVLTGKGEKTRQLIKHRTDIPIYSDLAAAVAAFLG